MSRLLPYFVLRSAAIELDRQGKRPGPVLTVLVGIASASTLGLLGIAGFAVLWTALLMAGAVH
jgi:hypothetical protein